MLVTKSLVKKIYKKKDDWSRKGDYGRLLVIGGSRLYSGSPAFSAIAACRAGCDLVTIAAPERAANIAASFQPDVIAYPLRGDYIEKKHVREILGIMHGCTAMVIGGGLTRKSGVLEAVKLLLRKSNLPTVVDADALHAVKGKLGENFLLTPHSHEFYLLSGKKPSSNAQDRIKKTKALAANLGCTVLLKGHVDTISDGRRTATNRTGSPYMTKGGMGDVLAGICGALLARGSGTFEAACCGAYINGLAGDIAAKNAHEGLMASDLFHTIPKAIERSLK